MKRRHVKGKTMELASVDLLAQAKSLGCAHAASRAFLSKTVHQPRRPLFRVSVGAIWVEFRIGVVVAAENNVTVGGEKTDARTSVTKPWYTSLKHHPFLFHAGTSEESSVWEHVKPAQDNAMVTIRCTSGYIQVRTTGTAVLQQISYVHYQPWDSPRPTGNLG